MADIKKQKTTARVLSLERIAPDIFDLRLETKLARDAKPGQFVGVYPGDKDLLLPRPVSICDAKEDRLRLVWRIAGKGTAALSTVQKGETIDILGLLGNGFPVDKAQGKRVLLCGGGVGIPPMLYLMRILFEQKVAAPAHLTALLGYRDKETFLSEEFLPYGDVVIATQDGSRGHHGTVIDAAHAAGIEADMICACGPKPMLQALKTYADGRETYLSLEERMACGVGVCLGCICKTTRTDAHSGVHNARVCTEGPVFAAKDVELS